MNDNSLFVELARFTYWFGTLLSFEIIFSMFYILDDGVRKRSNYRYAGTIGFAITFASIGIILYLSDRFLSELVTSYLINLENTLFPLAIFTVFFDTLYAVKVLADRAWRNPVVVYTGIISGIALGFAFFMIFNDNKLL